MFELVDAPHPNATVAIELDELDDFMLILNEMQDRIMQGIVFFRTSIHGEQMRIYMQVAIEAYSQWHHAVITHEVKSVDIKSGEALADRLRKTIKETGLQTLAGKVKTDTVVQH